GIIVGGDSTFQILNNDGGQITNGASISVTSTGGLSANTIDGFINNRNGGTIGSNANITFDLGGELATQGDANIGISSRNDGSGGGTIAGDATVNIQASSKSIGGFRSEERRVGK